ncbi:MAG: class I SAM-dependent methyltransferase [Trueperaceae bacterium]
MTTPPSASPPTCRLCRAPLTRVFVDLGAQPLCESYLDEVGLHGPETFYPLRTYVCDDCLLVQAEDFATPEEIFREYAYFSSYSASWLEHAARFSEEAAKRERLGTSSLVIEVASNDGYLLRNFVARGVRVLGVDPARNVAAAAAKHGVPTVTEFFGAELARTLVSQHGRADLVVANNVLAHVPDLHDFTAGLAAVLAPDGVVSVEVPHVLELIRGRQFDTIYHEHFSYLSLHVVERLFAEHGLEVVDIEQLATHGGSLRYWAAHVGARERTPAVARMREVERAAGLHDVRGYLGFEHEVRAVKRGLLKLLMEFQERGLRVAGYGAPGKGNTLLNYCGVREDLLPYTVDRNPYKHGKYLPGTHIPVYPPERLDADRPDVIVILPWNLKDEIVRQLEPARARGARFVVPIPEPTILP